MGSAGALLTSHPAGADWLSGGTVGPEGSALVFVVLIAVVFVIRWTLPPHAATSAPPLTSTAGAAAPGTMNP
jgi:hypothetical protein